MKKVAVFFAPGFEEVEALTTVNILRRAEIEVIMVSITDELIVKGAREISVLTEKLITELDFNSIDMIVLPGGYPGFINLEANEMLMEQVDLFHAQKKPIAAICGAPGVLGRRGILKGSMACAFPGLEDSLLGATIVYEPAVWDGHLITGRAMGCSVDFALAILASIKGFAAADEMAKTIVYKQ